MFEPKPKRQWWRKKRWCVAIPVWVVACYAAAFVPTCWIAVRSGPLSGGPTWSAAERAYRPAASVLMASPPWVRQAAVAAVESGLPAGIASTSIPTGSTPRTRRTRGSEASS